MRLSQAIQYKKRPKKWLAGAVPESHRGRFTAKANAAGMGVQSYADKVLAPGSKADTTTKRQAVFARRAKGGF